MEGEANLPAPAPSVNTKSINLARSINQESHSSIHSSASSQKSSSSPEFLRNVQAAFKRHRPIGGTLMPRRMVLPQRDMLKSSSGLGPGIRAPNNKLQEAASLSQGCSIGDGKHMVSVRGENHEDASISPPSISGSITNNYDEDYDPFDGQRNEDNGNHSCNGENANMSSNAQPQRVPVGEGSKRVQFSMASSVTSQGMPFLFFNHGADAGADDRMATGIDNLSSHMSSLALAEMEWDTGNQAEPSNIVKNEQRHQPNQTIETEGVVRADGASSSFAVRTSAFHDQIQNLRNFLQGDANQPMTQSSVVGSSCATTISVHATSAPVLNSMTKCSSTNVDNTSVEAVGSLACSNLTHHNSNQGDGAQQPYSASIPSNVINNQAMNMVQALSVPANMQVEAEELKHAKAAKGIGSSTDVPPPDKKLNKAKGSAGHAADVLMQAPSSKKVSADMKSKPSKSENPESSRTDKISGAPRKKGYDPDVFFKVNGKFYQRLGKIGSGGSSEVHKVISSDCTIYALKRIKLKGRDYATAYGFCQEILYLNKLKGKSNIIQLIDYEVTDKALLQEVLNGCMNNKDGRVKDDGYIYMVLEYGEIDLAHMLSQKWKEMEDSDAMIDENWLRFYWQQILQAVNTIHEERIVHSDLKPANFLLVKGSLKLIDFGIAKAIMSDTTNIQRDAQVGTLSYMSPEAFMCNERDADGNVIKCGRSSDIWSLGCILYQMVYGRTPFSEYRTFWAKFKVITDPNYEISYEPLANHWLLDLMKKCLAWDRNKRWRIPQLLQHPFLVPPSPSNRLPALEYQTNKAIQLIAESCANNQEASVLCCQLQQLLNEDTTVSKDQQCRLLSQISKICIQLQVNIQRQE